MVKTTLNLRERCVRLLDVYAARCGLSRSELVQKCIQEGIGRERSVHSYRRLRYQERDPDENWTQVHVSLSGRDYELFHDVRKFFKVSVSLFISDVIDGLLQEIVRRILSNTNEMDKNAVSCYSIIASVTGKGDICWKLYWGLPENVP
jgi:hypothetical protein